MEIKKRFKGKMKQVVIFSIGFILCCYPVASGIVEGQIQKNAVKTYSNSVSTVDKAKIKTALKDAENYNSILCQTMGGSVAVGNTNDILNNYEHLLDITGNGIMATIEIPKISVNLPVFHGTSDEVLSKGVGHVQDTSLPIGGNNTRSILTGHRGLPTAKLFTRLDELEKGDLFYITVCEETLAYQVNDIQEIKPEDVSKLEIVSDKDLVSLITCTPYGINTHRLVVTGERVPYNKVTHDEIDSKMMSYRELIFTCLPFVFVLLAVYPYGKSFINNLKKRKEKKADEKEN